MLHRLEDGDVVYFINNLKKDGTFGENIVNVDLFFLQTEKGNCFITEDPNLPLFPELKKIYWEHRKKGTSLDGLRPSSKYYSYGIINNEYKLFTFGYTISKLLAQYSNSTNDLPDFTKTKTYRLDVKKEIRSGFGGGFPTFENSTLTETTQEMTIDFLKTKTMYIEDIVDKMKWSNDENYKILIEFFKENNIESDPIKEITIKQRELKLNRILQQGKVEITIDTLMEIKEILDDKEIIIDEVNNILNKLNVFNK